MRSAVAAALCCAAAATAHAQSPTPPTAPPPPPLPLSRAVDAAWTRALQAREAQARTWRADAERRIADSPWAGPPAVELSHRDDRFGADTGQREMEAGLSWPLWLPGQRAARVAAADAEAALAVAAVDAGRLFLGGALRTAWRDIRLARADLAAAAQQQDTFSALAADVRRRVDAGDLARADALAADAEALAASTAQTQARVRLAEYEARWQVLSGLPAPGALMDTTSGPDAFDLQAHPDVRFAQLEVERARRQLEVVERERRDAPELSVRLRQDVAGRGAGSQHSLGLGVRIPFATDSRNSPRLAAAREELTRAEFRLERLNDTLPAAERLARQEVADARAMLDAEQRRSALLDERASLVRRAFAAGETPLPEMLRATAAATQSQSTLARQRAALEAAQANLLQAAGVLP